MHLFQSEVITLKFDYDITVCVIIAFNLALVPYPKLPPASKTNLNLDFLEIEVETSEGPLAFLLGCFLNHHFPIGLIVFFISLLC